MAKGRRKKAHNIGHANNFANRTRRLKTEVHKAEKKMEKLLRLFKEERPRNCGDTVRKIQGIAPGSKRHKSLQAHISFLKGKMK